MNVGKRILLCAAAAIVFPAVFALACSTQAFAQAETVKTQDLIENAEHYDGKQIAIEGEAVGDIMRRGGMAWITVNDDPYSQKNPGEGGGLAGISNSGIGVCLPTGEAEKIRILGSYKHKGDRVRVTGIFRRADHESGGDTVIRGISLEVIEPGHPIAHPVRAGKVTLAFSLAALVLILGRRWLKRRGAP